MGLPRAFANSIEFKSIEEYFNESATGSTIGDAIENAKINAVPRDGSKFSGTTENTANKYALKDTTTSILAAPCLAEETEDPAQNELPYSDSAFKMTEELFRAAKQAEPGSAASFWSHRLYRGPVIDGIQTRPTVHYCRSSKSTEKILESYFMDHKVVGFDIEWRADALRFHGPRANVSLVQVATEERIGLFHIALYPRGDDLASPLLKKLMADPNISKVGVSIKSDCTRIKKHLNIECQGLFELSHLFKLVKYSQNRDFDSIDKKLVSLAKQVQEHLHLPLFKGGDVRSSDWSKKLQLHQLIYAASDCYAAIQLYHTLETKRKALIPTPPRPSHAELNIPIRPLKD